MPTAECVHAAPPVEIDGERFDGCHLYRVAHCDLCPSFEISEPTKPHPVYTGPDGPPPSVPGLVLATNGHKADVLQGMLKRRAVFLLCGGPSLANMPLELLQQRGILTAGVNQLAATTFRPHMWFSVDPAAKFHETIWTDPAIMKFTTRERSNEHFKIGTSTTGRHMSEAALWEMPNMWFYRNSIDKDGFNPDAFLTRSTVVWGGMYRGEIEVEKRSVMLAALRLLYWLGAGVVYLVGCDFHMRPERSYCFEGANKEPSTCGVNNTSYGVLNHWFSALRPRFERAGFHVFNCTLGGGLHSFERVKFETAVEHVLSTMPAEVDVRGLY